MQQYYQDRILEEETALKKIRAKYNRVSNLRLLAILLFALTVYFVIQTTLWLTLAFFALVVLGFYFLVKHHEALDRKRQLKSIEIKVLLNELRILGKGENVYSNGQQFEDEKHAFSYDLDLFGHGSVFYLANRAKTSRGQEVLASSLLSQPIAEEIKHKQEVVKELVKRDHWRQEFQAALFEIDDQKAKGLIDLEAPPNIPFEKGIMAYRYGKWVIAPMLLACFYLYGLEYGLSILVILLGLHLALSFSQKKQTGPYYAKLKGISRAMGHYAQALNKVLEVDWESEIPKQLKAEIMRLQVHDQNPIYDFQTMVKRIEMKENKMASPFLFLFSPFDLVELAKLKKWYAARPGFFSTLFETIAEFEKYSSAATLAFNHPKWSFPKVLGDENLHFKSKALGHPLIESSVTNDFGLNSQNRLSLITGSNMSGKSTFLRTVGTHIQMAYAGMPVSAESIQLSSGILLYTYMRIKDSLQENASTFKAEIDRIKLLLDAMFSEQMTLVLVDEMLRGTNSEDKLKGSMAFLEKVIESEAFAIVATHDLRTTEMAGKYADKVKNFYFEYDTQNGELAFDYKLKPGVCKSFNASALLRKVGLDV